MNFRGASRDEPEINLIPFIDILLVGLIFMLVNILSEVIQTALDPRTQLS